ncbi:MAG: ParA family protein [Rhodospirillales bacterium]|jgi:chromosome partitioning protein|nr:chromosome partitioning protein ParA [Rhodospirillaceae bacterium]MDP6429258.1 ParA family protein [Rhodospirillales bacterium]MDP6646098.1 ParA family protein [Rhodospirillales bacterium]MDP6843105.1 ParA family protein [Rhodospirillales bacterium]|tara:strand:- start:399 stop:1109 length:711 start_codon:yes stop_codon:yes gene_type:complete
MASTICVINVKGGCGKTTVATHLAAALSSSGLKTALADWDRYRGATHWIKLRPKEAVKIELADWRKSFGAVPKGVQRVVIDCPASLKSKRVREVAEEADIIVVPILPSVFDEYATKLFLRDLEDIKKIRKRRKKVLLIGNRYRANSLAGRRLTENLSDLGHPANHQISERSVYPQLAALGLTVFDLETKSMIERQMEWLPLIQEIETAIQLPFAKPQRPKKSKKSKKSRKSKKSKK